MQLQSSPVKDLLAGLTVAIVALPLALAFGIASGLGPESGLTTAIVAGALAAFFGGSRFQVSGPTGAMTVVLIPIFRDHGTSGVLATGLIAGLLLLVAAAARLGQLIHRLPDSLIEGFTVGIAVVIALTQFEFLPDLLSFSVAVSVAIAMLLAGRFVPKLPAGLFLIVLWAAATALAGLPMQLIGSLPAQIGRLDFKFLQVDIGQLILPGIAVALLAALESLLSAKIADQMRPDAMVHRPNQELFGQGIANIVVPFFGGVPATAALARTAVNVNSGAQSKLAAISHAAILAAMVMLFAPMVELIPLAALAGVLLATAARMVRFKELKQLLGSGATSALVLICTLAVTVFVDLISALVLGVLLHLLLTRTKIGRSLTAKLPDTKALRGRER